MEEMGTEGCTEGLIEGLFLVGAGIIGAGGDYVFRLGDV